MKFDVLRTNKEFRWQPGFSLVEILVSMAVLSIGIVGAINIQVASIQATQQQIYASSAMQLVNEMADKMRGNPEQLHNASSPFLQVKFQASKDQINPIHGCFEQECLSSQLATADIAEWLQKITEKLPDARAVICPDDAPWNEQSQNFNWDCTTSSLHPTVVIKLSWTDKHSQHPIQSPRIVIPVVPSNTL